VKRRGLPRAKGETAEAALAAHAVSLDEKGLRGLVLELSLARGAYFSWATRYSERLSAAAGAYGIDVPAIEKQTATELEARRGERSARKPPTDSPGASE
jgi:ParB family transcriptional regulator, chromosome partitioning protein